MKFPLDMEIDDLKNGCNTSVCGSGCEVEGNDLWSLRNAGGRTATASSRPIRHSGVARNPAINTARPDMQILSVTEWGSRLGDLDADDQMVMTNEENLGGKSSRRAFSLGLPPLGPVLPSDHLIPIIPTICNSQLSLT